MTKQEIEREISELNVRYNQEKSRLENKLFELEQLEKENVEHANKVLNVLSAYEIANNNKKKKIKQIDFVTGYVIKTFNSIREASKETNIPASSIVAVLKNRQKRTYEYSWCYVESLEEE